MFNFFKKKEEKPRSKYQDALKSLKDDVSDKIYFKLIDKNKVIELRKNHLTYHYNTDKDKYQFVHFYGKLTTVDWVRSARVLFSNQSKEEYLVVKFGSSFLDEIRINKKNKKINEFMEELGKRHYDYLKRIVELSS
jgi:uncharacterized hydantoinase/oxoprolinase family protein